MPVRTANNDLEQLWATNQAYVKRLLFELTGNNDLAEDLLQDTYIHASEGFAGYRGGSIRAWLGTIARNTFYNHARKHSYSRECPLSEDVAAETGLEPGGGSHLDVVETRKAISSLPPALRDVLMMKHYGGFTYEEIGKKLGCPSGTVKWRVSLAVDQLKHALGHPASPPAECAFVDDRELIDYLLGIGSPKRTVDIRQHLVKCPTCRKSAEHIRSIMIRLDELDGDHKLIEILDLDHRGVPTLYYDASIMNQCERPLDRAPFRMNKDSKLLHVSTQGEQVECDYIQDDHFSWDSSPLIRSRYAAPLSESIAPGEFLDLLTVTQMDPDRSARQLADNRFRFRWTQFPTIRWAADRPEIAVAYSQAIRLPQGSRLLKAYPLPAEIRTEAKTTLIWHSMLTQFGPFDCVVEYRVRPDWPDSIE